MTYPEINGFDPNSRIHATIRQLKQLEKGGKLTKNAKNMLKELTEMVESDIIKEEGKTKKPRRKK